MSDDATRIPLVLTCPSCGRQLTIKNVENTWTWHFEDESLEIGVVGYCGWDDEGCGTTTYYCLELR